MTIEQQPRPQAVLLGGGHGIYPQAIELATDFDVTAVVAMSDSGSATGRQRDACKTVPKGDLRRNLSGVSANGAGAHLEYRFGDEDTLDTVEAQHLELLGSIALADPEAERHAMRILAETTELSREIKGLDKLAGHTYGSWVIEAACRVHDYDLVAALDTISSWVDARARVLPVTTELNDLMAQDGSLVLRHEHIIDDHEFKHPKDVSVWLDPDAALHSDPGKATEEADLIVVGPGSMVTSQLAVLAAGGMREALEARRGALVAVINPIEANDSRGLHVVDHVAQLERHTGVPFDAVIYNDNQVSVRQRGFVPVDCGPEKLEGLVATHDPDQMIGADLLAPGIVTYDPRDPRASHRSPLHYDPERVGALLRAQVGM